MKGTVKLKKRLEALGLALLFMLQSVLGFLPGMIFSAAGAVKSIEVWDSDQLIDYGYRFNMKFRKKRSGLHPYAFYLCNQMTGFHYASLCRNNIVVNRLSAILNLDFHLVINPLNGFCDFFCIFFGSLFTIINGNEFRFFIHHLF